MDSSFKDFFYNYMKQQKNKVFDVSGDINKQLTPSVNQQFSDKRVKNIQEEKNKIIEKYLDQNKFEWPNTNNFTIFILDKRITSASKTLRRIRTFKTMVYMANWDGILGYGWGGGGNFEVSLEKAIDDAKKNLVAINLYPQNTWP